MAGRAPIPRSLAVATAIVFAIATVGPAASVFAADAPEDDGARHKKAVKTIAQTFKQLKIKNAPIVHADGIADGVDSQTGQPSSMPRSADPVAVGYAVVEMGKPQVNVFTKKVTAKNSAAIIGNQAMMSAGQRWLIVVVVTDQQFRKGNTGGLQVLLGWSGQSRCRSSPAACSTRWLAGKR